LGSGVTSATTDGEWIWVTDWNRRDGNLLLRVHPLTGDVMQMPSGSLEQLAEAGESGLWGSGRDLETDRPGIVRFDPESMDADASVGLGQGQSPIALAVAPGSVWTVSYEEGVTRVELRPA
jgi:streptogramin lyase